MSDKFLAGINSVYKSEYMLNDYTKRIADWCIDYYRNHSTHPNTAIKDIFKVEKENMSSAEANVIKKILRGISEEHEEDGTPDAEYLLRKTRDHFKDRSLKILFTKGMALVDARRFDKAQKLIDERKQIGSGVSNSSDLMSEEEVALSNIDTTEERLFRFEGKLGEITGWFYKGWLIAFLAPMKRGKTWMLLYAAICAVEAGLKVFIVSLEMNKPSLMSRLYAMITGASIEGGVITVPVFDCYFNQTGECRKRERVQGRKLMDENGNKPDYDRRLKYRVCTYCREHDPKNYEPETWFERLRTKKLTVRNTLKAVKTLTMQTNGKLRGAVYPAFSATITDVKNELNELELQGYTPDVILIDHADILASELHISERGNIDYIWKGLKQLAGERNCAVFTASQANRASIDQESLRQINVAEDIRKLAHVDVMFGINQTEEEYKDQAIRISTMAHRHVRTGVHQVKIIQALDIGQPVFDSEIC